MPEHRLQDVPAAAAEPPIAVFNTGLTRLVQYSTTKPFMDDDAAYIKWLFTWQLKPEIREMLKHHIPSDEIPLYMTKDPVLPDGEADSKIGLTGASFGFGAAAWPEAAVSKALGAPDPNCIAALSPFSQADFAGLAFGDKMTALAALGSLTPVQQIKLARHI